MSIKNCFLLILAFNSLVSLAKAEEIRVVDRAGLVRAMSDIHDSCKVIVKYKAPNNNTPKQADLQNIDGIASDIHGTSEAQGTVVFRNVNHGVWKVILQPQELSIVDVSIAK